MSAASRRPRRPCPLAILVCLLAAPAALGQRAQELLPVGAGGELLLHVEVHGVFASARPGGYGFARFTARNSSSELQTVDCAVEGSFGRPVAMRDRLQVPPGERRDLTLPVPGERQPLWMVARVRSTGHALRERLRGSVGGSGSWSLGVVDDPARTDSGWSVALAQVVGAPESAVRLAPPELPPVWWYLSGFDLLLVDGRTPTLDAAVQGVLRDWLIAGGDLVVTHAAQLPPGPLAELAPADERVRGQPQPVGLGRLALPTAAESARAPGVLPSVVTAITRRAGEAIGERELSGVAPDAMAWLLEIPGVGEVPLRAFFVVLLLFAVAVGPVNYFLLQRRRRQALLLVTVPALGFGTALVVLLFGLFGEGLGTRAALRTVTWLDQEGHRAATWAQRTLYAGLGPRRITPAADTLLDSLADQRALRRAPDGSYDGGLVPSRTPVTLVTTSVGPQRARLRFERREAARVVMLEDPGLSPVQDGVASVLLHAPDGEWYAGAARGEDELQRVSAERAAQMQRRLLSHLALPQDPLSSADATGGELPARLAGALRAGAVAAARRLPAARRRAAGTRRPRSSDRGVARRPRGPRPPGSRRLRRCGRGEGTVSADVVLEACGLCKDYGRLRAVDDVGFALRRGRVTGFVGPNGAGKTTTMRILATLELPDAGDAWIEGQSVLEEPRAVRERVGFMADRFEPYPNLDVLQFLDFFARAYGLRGRNRIETVRQVASFCGLLGFRDRPATGLSKGMGQRLHLAKTLLHAPSILVLDEPAAGLDPRARIDFRELVRELAADGVAVLVSSHILAELAEICDDVLVIEQGRLAVSGALSDVLRAVHGAQRVALRVLGDDGPDRAHRFLLTAPHVHTVDVLGERVEFSFDGDDAALAELLRRAIEHGLSVVEFVARGADLEEIFLHATQGRLQ